MVGTKFLKLQILTIRGPIAGTDRAEYPDLSHPMHPIKHGQSRSGQGTFKKAMVEDVSGEHLQRLNESLVVSPNELLGANADLVHLASAEFAMQV